jgi:SAM-dependent methyltransferase
MFLRKTRIEPLPVTMSAVRMGERVLQIGVDDPAVASAIAAKTGLSGSAAIVVTDERDAERAQTAMAHAGILVDVKVTPLASLPFENDSFDLVVVHAGRGASLDVLRESHRVVRHGGRVMTVEGGPASGLTAMFKTPRPPESDVVGVLQTAGFRSARLLAEREGYRFAEGMKS